MRLILKLLVNTAALWAASYLVSGIDLDGSVWTILLVGLVFGIINTFIKPIFKLLSFPVIMLTLGLFAFVINAAMLAITAALTDALSIENFWAALLGAIVISVVSAILGWFVPDN
jgi:putative membrane protein